MACSRPTRCWDAVQPCKIFVAHLSQLFHGSSKACVLSLGLPNKSREWPAQHMTLTKLPQRVLLFSAVVTACSSAADRGGPRRRLVGGRRDAAQGRLCHPENHAKDLCPFLIFFLLAGTPLSIGLYNSSTRPRGVWRGRGRREGKKSNSCNERAHEMAIRLFGRFGAQNVPNRFSCGACTKKHMGLLCPSAAWWLEPVRDAQQTPVA